MERSVIVKKFLCHFLSLNSVFLKRQQYLSHIIYFMMNKLNHVFKASYLGTQQTGYFTFSFYDQIEKINMKGMEMPHSSSKHLVFSVYERVCLPSVWQNGSLSQFLSSPKCWWNFRSEALDYLYAPEVVLCDLRDHSRNSSFRTFHHDKLYNIIFSGLMPQAWSQVKVTTVTNRSFWYIFK